MSQRPDRIVEPMLGELEGESEATLKLLERVPEEKLTWKPHEKSMSLGQLAYHLATVQGTIANFLSMDAFDATTADFTPRQPATKAEILDGFAEAKERAKATLDGLTNDQMLSEWQMLRGGQPIWTVSKVALARRLMFNHAYHHRGQLSVYLRLLDVPVPATYGRSADESAMG
jgi:uncharacterized damage-inducible protein DinB